MSILKKEIDSTTKWLLTFLMTVSAILLLFYSFQMRFVHDGVDGKNIFFTMGLVNGISILVVSWYAFRHVSLQYAWAGILSLVLICVAWCLLALSILDSSVI